MPGLTQTGHNFSLLSFPQTGKLSLIRGYRLDGKHVVFGELIGGDEVLKNMELGGS